MPSDGSPAFCRRSIASSAFSVSSRICWLGGVSAARRSNRNAMFATCIARVVISALHTRRLSPHGLGVVSFRRLAELALGQTFSDSRQIHDTPAGASRSTADLTQLL